MTTSNKFGQPHAVNFLSIGPPQEDLGADGYVLGYFFGNKPQACSTVCIESIYISSKSQDEFAQAGAIKFDLMVGEDYLVKEFVPNAPLLNTGNKEFYSSLYVGGQTTTEYLLKFRNINQIIKSAMTGGASNAPISSKFQQFVDGGYDVPRVFGTPYSFNIRYRFVPTVAGTKIPDNKALWIVGQYIVENCGDCLKYGG